jgi:hypothetical protein
MGYEIGSLRCVECGEPAEIGDMCEFCVELEAEAHMEWAEEIVRRDTTQEVKPLVKREA